MTCHGHGPGVGLLRSDSGLLFPGPFPSLKRCRGSGLVATDLRRVQEGTQCVTLAIVLRTVLTFCLAIGATSETINDGCNDFLGQGFNGVLKCDFVL